MSHVALVLLGLNKLIHRALTEGGREFDLYRDLAPAYMVRPLHKKAHREVWSRLESRSVARGLRRGPPDSGPSLRAPEEDNKNTSSRVLRPTRKALHTITARDNVAGGIFGGIFFRGVFAQLGTCGKDCTMMQVLTVALAVAVAAGQRQWCVRMGFKVAPLTFEVSSR